VQKALLNQAVKIIPNKIITHANGDNLEARSIYTNEAIEITCKTLILVTERQPNNTLYQQLIEQEAKLEGVTTSRHIEVIGDVMAPGLIANAIFSGHLAAENYETPEIEIECAMYVREMPSLLTII
jgi:dimethylamine/trimethylamine dehydrogenase